MGKGGLAHGQFGVLVPPGRDVVALIRSMGDADERVASRFVPVTAP